MNQVSQNTSDIENEITNLVVELFEAITPYQKAGNKHDTDKYLDIYSNGVTRIGFRVGKSDLKALRESCVIFYQIIDDLKNRSQPITTDEFEQLEVWPTLILTYLANPDKTSSDKLLEFLQNPVWSTQPNNTDIQQLSDYFYDASSKIHETDNQNITRNEVSSEFHEEISTTDISEFQDNGENRDPSEILESVTVFDGALLESIQQEILEAMSDLLSDLDSIDPDDDFGFSHALSLCADRIELLGMSIATAGLLGLMDVCILFQTGLRVLSKRELPVTKEEQEIIEEWPAHLITYLSSPSDPDVSEVLIQYLANIPWTDPMSEEEIMTLREILVAEDIEVIAPVETSFEQDDLTSASIDQGKINFEVPSHESGNHEKMDDFKFNEMYFLGQELIKLIHDEFKSEKSSLEETLTDISANTELSDKNLEQLSLYNSIIERFSLATESIGLSGLNKILTHLFNNLSSIIEKNHPVIDEILEYLQQYPGFALNYLSHMDDRVCINSLTSPLFISDWPVSIEMEEGELENELFSPSLLIEDDIEIRATQASSDDVSLTLPEDVNQQLLDSLLQELPVQTAEFTDAITQLVDGSAKLNDVQRAQRIAHTLKGAANTVGVTGIATLTHHIEDIFSAFTKHQRLPGKKLAETLMRAADVLEMMSEALLGIGDIPEQAQNVLQQILDWANLIDQEGIPEEDAEIRLTHDNETDVSQKDDDTRHLTKPTAKSMLRVPAALMDSLLRLAGESIILGGQLQESLRQAMQQTELAHEQNSLYQQLVYELEHIVDIQGLAAQKTNIRLSNIFDSLELEQYNELHTVTHRLVEAAADSKALTQNIEDELNSLDTLLVDQDRLHKENQEIVMQTRMIPVNNIVPRLQRSIRQTCLSTGKKVDLNVIGTETLMDSDVLNVIIDPIMHILRNAVDHGIEDEKSRISKNKDFTGKIELSFYRDGDHIVVRCVDDGAGLDIDAIRNTAIRRKIITSSQEISDNELIRFIWLAGFTTREETTQVSGRGIGMDSVYNKITGLKGELSISSEKDIGCTVELRLPLTLISVHAIMVKSRQQTLAISNRGIEQILCPEDGKLIFDNNRYSYHQNDAVYDAYDIEKLLQLPVAQKNINRDDRTVLLVRDETGNHTAISVEQVTGNQDLVIKQLGVYLPDIAGIEGATILGDGSIAPVLDLQGLIRTTNKDINHYIENHSDSASSEGNIVALVVDDSLSARRALAEFVRDIGYEVCMARDGIEALEVIDTRKPDIILADLEMPRMNGLELTSHIRSNSETRDLPVIMITSRSTDKHREMAKSVGVNTYLTKPFPEDKLLESIQNLLLTV